MSSALKETLPGQPLLPLRSEAVHETKHAGGIVCLGRSLGKRIYVLYDKEKTEVHFKVTATGRKMEV